MNVTGTNYQLMKSSFATEQKKNATLKEQREEEKKSSGLSFTSNYEDMIENIQEQIKKVNENQDFDEDTKKAKLKELQDQIDEIRNLQEMEKTRKLEEAQAEKEEASKKKVEERNKLEKTNTVDESKDGDLLILSENAKDLIKSDLALDKLEAKDSMRKELKAETKMLKNQIEIDQGRGVESKHKAEDLDKLESNLDAINNEEKPKIETSENKPYLEKDDDKETSDENDVKSDKNQEENNK